MSQENLTLEKLRIHERLSALEVKVDSSMASHERMMDRLGHQIEALQTHLLGDGQVGLTTRLDRLEQAHRTHQRNILALWTTAVGAGVKFILDYFKHP